MSSLIAKDTSTGGFDPIEAGTYPAICCAIIDIGLQYNKVYDKENHQVVLMFELPTETFEADGIIRSRTISGTYTLSLTDKSNLRKMLESWRAKAFTPEELEGFDLEKVLGLPCFVNVIDDTNATTGKTYSKIGSVSEVPKGFTAPVGREEPLLFDLEADNAQAILPILPERIKKRIFESETYKKRFGESGVSNESYTNSDGIPMPFDDDLPF